MPALSPLPTVTSHARGAIFLGELPSDPLVAETVFRDQDEAKTDKARLQPERRARGADPQAVPQGRPDRRGPGAALGAGRRERVGGGRRLQRVDDQIGSSNTGATVRISPEDITGSSRALEARRSRRAAACSSPPTTATARTSTSRCASATARRRGTRALGKHDAVPEGFIEIDVAGLGGPPERRAFAWRSGAYLGGPQVGFHGGARSRRWSCRWRGSSATGSTPTSPRGGTGAARSRRSRRRLAVPPPIVTPTAVRRGPDPGRRPQLSLFNPADKADSCRCRRAHRQAQRRREGDPRAPARRPARRAPPSSPTPEQEPRAPEWPHASRCAGRFTPPATSSSATRCCPVVRRCTGTKPRRRGADGRRP
jgi:hypothetical protein